MPTFVKSMILGLGLAAGMSAGVYAQTVAYPAAPYPTVAYPTVAYPAAPYSTAPSIAALPPNAVAVAPAPPAAAAPVAPVAVVVPTHGPDPGRGWYPTEKQTRVVVPSPEWIGPRPN